jgi:hypothetical protein
VKTAHGAVATTEASNAKFLITLAILVGFIAAVSAMWIFGGRQISLFIDRIQDN